MTKQFVTPNGKEIEIFYEGRNLAVRFKGGGTLPAELQGTWTNHTEVEKSINIYLAKKS